MSEKIDSFLPAQASTIAPQIDNLYIFITVVSVFFTVLAVVLVAIFSFKYRRRSESEIPQPPPEHSSLEFICGGALLVLVMIMFAWGAIGFARAMRIPNNAKEILVVGKQWMWKLQHPNGRREINQLHIPIGETVKLTMTSEDVIHSFYIPAFRVKNDVVPGRYTSVWFTPTQIGTNFLFCAEYCGAEHSKMGGWIYVMSTNDYEAWMATRTPGDEETPVQAGQRLFTQVGCVSCHMTDSKVRGPSLNGIVGTTVTFNDGAKATVDEGYLREAILNSQAHLVAGYDPIMPLYKGLLTEEQVIQLIAYIKSLSSDGGSDSGS